MHLPRPRLVPSPAALLSADGNVSAFAAPGSLFWGTQTQRRVTQAGGSGLRVDVRPSARWGSPPSPVLSVPDSAQVLRSLNKTYQNLKRKPVAVDLDPKAVTCDELFGIINPATREWKDGT